MQIHRPVLNYRVDTLLGDLLIANPLFLLYQSFDKDIFLTMPQIILHAMRLTPNLILSWR